MSRWKAEGVTGPLPSRIPEGLEVVRGGSCSCSTASSEFLQIINWPRLPLCSRGLEMKEVGRGGEGSRGPGYCLLSTSLLLTSLANTPSHVARLQIASATCGCALWRPCPGIRSGWPSGEGGASQALGQPWLCPFRTTLTLLSYLSSMLLET